MAASAFTIFEPRPLCKRKREFSNEPEEFDSDDDRRSKRPLIQKNKSKVYAQLPTPDDSDHDEDTRIERNVWYQRRALVRTASTCSMTSVKVNFEDLDSDMDPLSPVSINVRNNIRYSPNARPQLTLLAAVPIPLDARLPTPTASLSIDTSLRSASRRSWHAQLHTTLSPLIGEEIGFLSPTEPLDAESVMILDSASEILQGLNVYCPEDMMHTDGMIKHQATCTSSTTPRHETGRKAKLHMGYRTDCEKCAMQVPGHYSHILWS